MLSETQHGAALWANIEDEAVSPGGRFGALGLSAPTALGGLPKQACGGASMNGFHGATASPHLITALEPVDSPGQASGRHAAPRERRRGETKILIVDDCTLYRENLAAVLGANRAVAPCVAWDLPSLQTALEEGTPHIVLLSTSTKDAAALLRTIVASSPDAKVIAMGVSENDEPTIVACAEAGVAGYHLRSESFNDLLLMIRNIRHGDTGCSPRVGAILLRRLSILAAERQPEPEELVLTAREIQILRMLEKGLSNRDIADQLCIALHTVKNHVHSLLGKLGVSSRAQAVAVSRSMQYSTLSSKELGPEPV
jgi:DNA-binding NarL/FixJ family response regulator